MVVDQLTRTLAAAAHPTRRSILRRLAAGPATVGDLARPFRMSQQAISKHVACLAKARLIEKRRVGRRHVCRLRPAPIREVAEWAAEYRRFWEQSFERLDELLAELKSKERQP
jgi:DNA-binding transcriptional ArsR family regulator